MELDMPSDEKKLEALNDSVSTIDDEIDPWALVDPPSDGKSWEGKLRASVMLKNFSWTSHSY